MRIEVVKHSRRVHGTSSCPSSFSIPHADRSGEARWVVAEVVDGQSLLSVSLMRIEVVKRCAHASPPWARSNLSVSLMRIEVVKHLDWLHGIGPRLSLSVSLMRIEVVKQAACHMPSAAARCRLSVSLMRIEVVKPTRNGRTRSGRPSFQYPSCGSKW